MWRFVAGISIGVYIGTYYNCKPMIEKVIQHMNDNFPDKKS